MTITPHDLGMPEKFSTFYPGQFHTIQKIVRSEKRFIALQAPPGAGKSLIYVCAATLLEYRTAILTITRGLQTQLANDFHDVKSIMASSNYACKLDMRTNCDDCVCFHGETCLHRLDECFFYSALRAAQASMIAVTNPAFWFFHNDLASNRDLLVLDEAHKLMDFATGLLGFSTVNPGRLSLARDIRERIGKKNLEWVLELIDEIDEDLKSMQEKLMDDDDYMVLSQRCVEPKNRYEKLKLAAVKSRIEQDPTNWVIDSDNRQLSLSPIWPSKYLEEVMYRDISKVIFVSATIYKDGLKHLGVDPKEVDFIDLSSLFPANRRPFIYVKAEPRVCIDYRLKPVQFNNVVRRVVDRLVQTRTIEAGRKGIIHTVSYRWAHEICERSKHGKYLMTHDRRNTARVVEQFKNTQRPVVLLSPAIDSGYDFIDDYCRWQLIWKLCFPDQRNPLIKHRCKEDRSYRVLSIVKSIIQQYGRSTRSTSDWSEVFIIDLHWAAFYEKHFNRFPRLFTDAYEEVDGIPPLLDAQTT